MNRAWNEWAKRSQVSVRGAATAIGLCVALLAADSAAVGTRRIELRDGSDLKGGELVGVAIDSTGRVSAGFNLGKVAVSEANSIWAMLPRKDGSLLLGTGNEGKLLEVRGTVVKVLVETKAMVITSLVEAWGDAVIVGTMPDAKLLKWQQGKLTELAKLPDTEHIWALAYDPKAQALFAGTGPAGKLFRITQDGKAQVYFDAEEQHIMSLALANNGRVLAGASDKAKLYEVRGPGRASVLYDFDRTEVRAIAVGKAGDVFAIANEIKTGRRAPTRSKGNAATPVKRSPKVSGKGTLYRFDKNGVPEQLLNDDDEHFVSLALNDAGKPYVGTGVEGRIYTVDDSRNSVLVADTDERQASALLVRGTQRFVATSDPAVLHPIRGIGGPDAVWTSKVLDTGIRAHFGRMSWTASGKIELSTRSGNTKEPDDTWSEWSQPLTDPGAAVASPAARYLQVRARFNHDATAVLRDVTIPFVTDNLRAVITSVEVEQPRSDAVSDGKGTIKASGGPIDDDADSKIELKWEVDNPDKDQMRYRLEYRLVGTTQWFDVLPPREKLTKTSYDWDTSDLPEGRYRLRIVATDELANPPERVKRHEQTSEVVLVDNTPPTVQGLTVNGRRIQGTALDGVGPIARIELSVAGSDEWVPFFPKDGIFDEQREEFDIDATPLSAQGAALLALRIYDQANNVLVQSVTLR